ncbi:MAG: dioxygenase, partial [Myxococcales bacterium]
MRNLTEANLTDAVLARVEGCKDPRVKQILESVIRHVHTIVREVELTPDEWLEAIRFLTATGQKCDDKRQEFILLSDTLGVTMLVDAIANRRAAGGTESSVLGPFYVEGAPPRDTGIDLASEDNAPT